MKKREWLVNYFSFSRKDRIGILVVITLLILLLFGTEILDRVYPAKTPVLDTAFNEKLQLLAAQQDRLSGDSSADDGYQPNGRKNYQAYEASRLEKPRRELFAFDPNTIADPSWQRLGLRDKTIRTIRNFISKGGRFREPADLRKVYGLFPDEFERLEPYIVIAKEEKVPALGASSSPIKAKTFSTQAREPIDINTADSSAFISLPGIGSKLAGRILNFRDRLGGFISIQQISEVFGLPDSVFQRVLPRLVLSTKSIRTIDLNTATVDELKTHPYIRYQLANPIIRFRTEHGPFTSIDQLKSIMAVTDSVYARIKPYLSVQ